MIKTPLAVICIFFCVNIFAQRIPIDGSRWYQQNYTTGGLTELFDNNKDTKAFTGWSKILLNYDAYYPILPGESMTIDSVRFYDKEGVFTNYPMKLYAITDNWQRVLVAHFPGEYYNTWVGPYPSRPLTFKLDTAITNIRYLVLNINDNNFPGEIELYGPYTAGAVSTVATKSYAPLKNFFGINGFEWDLVDAVHPGIINPKKWEAFKGFRGFRHYMDWEKIEETEGHYTFNPVARGGWHYDSIYIRCKQEGIEVLGCLKTLPPWMIATYPQNQQDWDNNPVRYGKSFSDPLSYIEMAKVAFQYAARYGSNANVDTALVSVYSVPKWPGELVNTKRIGMNLVKYIECDNERDKWWKGRKGYLTGREYAANLSAFYDGNKNTMGAAAGVKNADSNMIVVMGGTAAPTPDYLRGMVDWCKEFRGYKADSSINFCWDVINYHFYSNDQGTSQSGSPTRGAAPDVAIAGAAQIVRTFLQASHDYAGDMPVWITEMGYDINQGSPLKAIAIGSKTILQTQADWILRSSLLYCREGLKKAFFYETYDANVLANYRFSSSGLIDKTDTSRKPATAFLFQANKLFGNYTFQQSLSNDPMVDKYMYNGQAMYALWLPSETGRTGTYTLALDSSAQYVTAYTPAYGGNDMSSQTLSVVNGVVDIPVSETPVFVVGVQGLLSKR